MYPTFKYCYRAIHTSCHVTCLQTFNWTDTYNKNIRKLDTHNRKRFNWFELDNVAISVYNKVKQIISNRQLVINNHNYSKLSEREREREIKN